MTRTAVTLLGAAAGFSAAALLVLARPKLLHHRPGLRSVGLVVAAAALLAALAPVHSTTPMAGELLMWAALGAGCAGLAWRASWPWVVLAGGVAVGTGHPPMLVGAAGAALGALVAGTAARRSTSLARVAAGGLVGALVLRQGATAPAISAAVSVVSVGGLLIGGLRGLRPTARRLASAASILALSVAAVIAAAGVLVALRARPHLTTGLRLARGGLTLAEQGHGSGASAALSQASAAFGAGQRLLNVWWAGPAGHLPVVGDNLRALRTIAATAADLAATGAAQAKVVDPGSIRVVNGRVPLERVAALEGPLQHTQIALSQAHRQLAGAGSPWLAGPVSSRLAELRRRVVRAETETNTALEAVRIGPSLLGGTSSKRYFLAITTPAELRASSGMIGSYGEVTAVDGTLHVSKIGRTDDLNTAAQRSGAQVVAPAEYLARYGRDLQSGLWQNVTESPDFPTVAGVIERLYPQSGGVPVDGVIAIDPIGLAALLKLEGPVQVPDWPVAIDTANVSQVLLHDEYVRLDGTRRVDFLGEVARAVIDRFEHADLASIPDVAQTLVSAVRGKHLVMSVPGRTDEALLDRLHLTGAMSPVDTDSLAVVTQNAGGNKIDWYLRRSVHYQVEVNRATGNVMATATVTLRNGAPPGGEPDYVLYDGADPTLARGTNRLLLSVYSPWAFTAATQDGRSVSMGSEPELGRYVYSAVILVPPGKSSTVAVTLTGHLNGTRYHVDVREQPTAWPDDLGISLAAQRRSGASRFLLDVSSVALDHDTSFTADVPG